MPLRCGAPGRVRRRARPARRQAGRAGSTATKARSPWGSFNPKKSSSRANLGGFWRPERRLLFPKPQMGPSDFRSEKWATAIAFGSPRPSPDRVRGRLCVRHVSARRFAPCPWGGGRRTRFASCAPSMPDPGLNAMIDVLPSHISRRRERDAEYRERFCCAIDRRRRKGDPILPHTLLRCALIYLFWQYEKKRCTRFGRCVTTPATKRTSPSR